MTLRTTRRDRNDWTPMSPALGAATSRAATGDTDEGFLGLDDAEWDEPLYDPDDSAEDGTEEPSLLDLGELGVVDPEIVLARVDQICADHLSEVEHDLIYLMRQGRRPVEISRVLNIPECEVVRLRKNCVKKIKIVYLYDYHHDKATFFAEVLPTLQLNPKQERILTMFYNYHGLRQIAETIGTRPSNVHRSLKVMRRKLEDAMAEGSPHRFYLGAFDDFKYLYLAATGTAE